MIVKIIKDWNWPNIFRQTSSYLGLWDDIQFTESQDECDYVIVLNNRMTIPTQVKCPPENVWAVMQEPYIKGMTDWMIERHEIFSKVFTHSPRDDKKYIRSHPAIPWHINRDFDTLVSCSVPEKTRNLSSIVGDAVDFPAHLKRLQFLHFLKSQNLDIDMYGKSIRYIKDKWDGLAPYKYSFAIENNYGQDCWTEKLADCFLTWTVPFYYGCTNLDDYFPKESYIQLNLDNFQESLEIIKENINSNNWQKFLPALEESRNLILHKYQFFPHMVKQIKSFPVSNSPRVPLVIPAYYRSFKSLFYRLIYRFKKKLIRRQALKYKLTQKNQPEA